MIRPVSGYELRERMPQTERDIGKMDIQEVWELYSQRTFA